MSVTVHKKPIVAFLRANSMRSDTRTLKMFRTILKINDCKPLLWNRDEVKDTTPNARLFLLHAPLGSKKMLLLLPFWTVFCLWHLILIKPAAIHGCDAEGFIPAYLYSRFRRVPIVFDIHDVTAGKYPLPHTSPIRKFFLFIDRFLISRSSSFFIPDPERLDQLEYSKTQQQALHAKCFVTYNSDIITAGHKHCAFSSQKALQAVYVGNLTRGIRGVEFLLEAIPHFPHIFFHIAGMGADAEYFQKAFKKLETSNYRFYGRISHAEAMKLNEEADVMISLLNPDFENYKYATSTKLFEAFRLFKPIIVSKNTATSRIIEKANWGLSVEYTSQGLKEALHKISTGAVTFDLDSARTEEYAWQKQEKTIIDTYERLLHS